MIAFRNNKNRSESDLIKKLLTALDSVYGDSDYYSGSYHENVDISEVIQIIYIVLYDSKNESLNLTINKKENNSLDLIIEEIK